MKLYSNIILIMSFSVYTFSSENIQLQSKLLEQKIDEVLSIDVSRLVKNQIKKEFAVKYEELYSEIHAILDQYLSDYDKKLEVHGNSIRESLTPLIRKIDEFEESLSQNKFNRLQTERESRCFVKESALVEYLDKLKKEFRLSLDEISVNVRLLLTVVKRHNDQLALLAKEQDSLKLKIDNLEKNSTSSIISLRQGLSSTRMLNSRTLPLPNNGDSFHSDFDDEG